MLVDVRFGFRLVNRGHKSATNVGVFVFNRVPKVIQCGLPVLRPVRGHVYIYSIDLGFEPHDLAKASVSASGRPFPVLFSYWSAAWANSWSTSPARSNDVGLINPPSITTTGMTRAVRPASFVFWRGYGEIYLWQVNLSRKAVLAPKELITNGLISDVTNRNRSSSIRPRPSLTDDSNRAHQPQRPHLP